MSTPPSPQDEWVRVDESRAMPRRVNDEGRRSAVGAPSLPADVASAIRRAADAATAHHREALVARMEKAVAAYERGRYPEALRYGTELVREVGTVPAVRRLAGFSAYRMGRWRDAARHLEAYTELSGEPDALAALMDALRALGRHSKVAAAWTQLRHSAADADVLAEARIVAAGSLADRGRLPEAIELLASAGAARALRNPSDRHLRQWYALADLFERAGDLPRARELFGRVARVDPEAYDVSARLDALGTGIARRPRGPRRARRGPRQAVDEPGMPPQGAK
ncbi:MAG: tetratricopeptide repeat protein [Actinomycetota bacterium]|nr:tetratricopeptide repeat protein [Actinomycetota bacterium]